MREATTRKKAAKIRMAKPSGLCQAQNEKEVSRDVETEAENVKADPLSYVVTVNGQVAFRLSDEAKSRLSNPGSILGLNDSDRERQGRILAATGLRLVIPKPGLWWVSVHTLGSQLVIHMRGFQGVFGKKEYSRMSAQADKLKETLKEFFEGNPNEVQQNPLFFGTVGALHALSEMAKVRMNWFPDRAPTRPTKSYERRLIEQLRKYFEEGFGQSATLTRGGEFERFLTAVLQELGGIRKPPGWVIDKLSRGRQKS
jgi:hypothetical protein